MKTILVGVDFTKSSDNTINYAIEVAEKSKAKVLLFHALTAPVMHTTSGLVFITGQDFMKDAGEKMELMKAQLSKIHPTVKFDIEITYLCDLLLVGEVTLIIELCLGLLLNNMHLLMLHCFR